MQFWNFDMYVVHVRNERELILTQNRDLFLKLTE